MLVEQGSLELILTWDGRQILAAGVVSTRPALARTLCGLSAARLLEVVPRLFSLCRHAQAAATRLSVEAARGERATSAAGDGLLLPVALETIAEHLYHLLIAWPTLLDDSSAVPRLSEFGGWRKRFLPAVVDRAAAVALGAELSAWLARFELPLLDDQEPVPLTVGLLPQLTASECASLIDRDDFASAPTLAGQPAETGVLARQAEAPAVAALLARCQRVKARLLARLIELRWLAAGLCDLPRLSRLLDASAITAGLGLARVETARGMLLHRTELDGERVVSHLIIAPTEWNFHPRGAFVREISGCSASTRLAAQRAAGRLALSLDPCVPCALRLVDA